MPEIRRLPAALVLARPREIEHVLAWSRFRQAHQTRTLIITTANEVTRYHAIYQEVSVPRGYGVDHALPGDLEVVVPQGAALVVDPVVAAQRDLACRTADLNW
ncbi:hypothetical protein [Streptosporangium amethystogenes]|uniref:hypothetical protein n=1 Tax=Streptosporangium amethystogenes TaxID=2002 RepID=UPI00147016CE|nr:hypothetical protein [Streptosporangium amethystogenes]